MSEVFKVSSSPHIRSNETTQRIMLDVAIALLPAGIFSIYKFGYQALIIILISVATCVLSEFVWQKLTKQAVTVSDISAVVTGLLLAYNLPHTVPYWMPVVGGIFAIILVKQFFGGLGQNFMNPALAARALLLTSWTAPMSTFAVDGVTSATPLTILSLGESGDLPSLFDVFIGNIGGSLGEVSAACILLGAAYLMYRGIINWRIPFIYIGTVFLLTTLLGGNGLYEIFAGGLMLGAFFMATDYSSTPMSPKGHIIFGLGCGILTVVIRKFGGYPEGVSYAIIIMNLTVPLIDRYTRPRVFGEVAKSE